MPTPQLRPATALWEQEVSIQDMRQTYIHYPLVFRKFVAHARTVKTDTPKSITVVVRASRIGIAARTNNFGGRQWPLYSLFAVKVSTTALAAGIHSVVVGMVLRIRLRVKMQILATQRPFVSSS
jgi:hypothetical protein